MYKKSSTDKQFLEAESMLSGLQSHQERLQRRGIDGDFLAEMRDWCEQASAAHLASLAYKARMMEQTAECQHCLDQIRLYYNKARREVKLELAFATWREFGIVDQR